MSVLSYKCPNCGGELKFDPETQKYKCDYCVSVFDTVEQIENEKTNEAEKSDSTDSLEAAQYHCPSCGAEIITEATTAASTCYYCHNPVVLSGRLSGEYLPDYIIPFQIAKDEAKQRFLDYVKKKKFIPKAFFNKKQMDQFSGVYFPYWIYGCSMQGELNANGTKTRVWVAGDIEYTENKYYQIHRSGEISLEELAKYALKKENHLLMEGIQPYHLKETKNFEMSYLSGFMAEKRDIEKEELGAEVKNEVQAYGENILRDTIEGYSMVSAVKSNMQIQKEKWSYALLPIWTMTYQGPDKKMYYYSMNGQTGKIYGKLPVNNRKVAVTGLIAGILTGLIFLLGGYLL